MEIILHVAYSLIEIGKHGLDLAIELERSSEAGDTSEPRSTPEPD